MRKIVCLLYIICIISSKPFSQSVSINSDGSLPNPNAMLDIKSSNKGLLIPGTSTTTRTSIPNTKGLLVYDTTITTLSFLSFVMYPSKPPLPNQAVNEIIQAHKPGSNGVLLVYGGSFKSPEFSYDIGIHFEMAPSIGVSYHVVFEQGDNTLSHIAIFYKFSNPNQATVYNYLNHKSYISYNNGGPDDGDPHVTVIGQETMDQYSCTHLQNLENNTSNTSKDDFWMCKNLPGFQALTKILNQLNSDAGSLAFNGTIFNWGGLVRMTHYYEDKKTGATQSAEIHLNESNPAMDFPSSDFEVPSK